MLRDETLVCFSMSPWDTGLPTACHHLMREFAAAGNRVLFVDRALSVKDLVTVERDTRMRSRLARTTGSAPRLRQVGDLFTLTPPPCLSVNHLPAGFVYETASRANAAILRRSVTQALSQLGWKATVVWAGFDLPGANAVAGRLGERLLVYHCYDELTGWDYLARHGQRLETRLISRSDVVFATSPALLRHKRQLAHAIAASPIVSYLPNGVDHRHFARALAPETTVPRQLQGLPRPVAGYLGNIEERLDFRLLELAAREIGGGTLCVAGPARGRHAERLRILATLPNVHVLGPVDPADAPGVLKAFDVGLIPFRQTLATQHVYPLKANEYLAAGLPVVASAFADLAELAPHVRVAPTPDAFCEAVRAAAADTGPGKRLERSRFAARNSWRRRAEAASEVMEHALDSRGLVEHQAPHAGLPRGR